MMAETTGGQCVLDLANSLIQSVIHRPDEGEEIKKVGNKQQTVVVGVNKDLK